MNKVIDFTKKNNEKNLNQQKAIDEMKKFISEITWKMYQSIQSSENEEEKKEMEVAGLIVYQNRLKEIKERYQLTDNQFIRIINSIDQKKIVDWTCSKREKL